MRKIGYLLVVGTFFIGCKAKKTVTSAENHRPEKPRETTVAHKVEKLDDGLYAMPEDTGEFIRFEIHSPEEYIETFSEIAQMEMKAYGIPRQHYPRTGTTGKRTGKRRARPEDQ